jgi:hypothetical protein
MADKDENRKKRIDQAVLRKRPITNVEEMDPSVRAIAEKLGLVGEVLKDVGSKMTMGPKEVPRGMEPLAEPVKHFGEAVGKTKRPTSLNRFVVDPIRGVPLTQGGMLDPESGLGRAFGKPGGFRNWVEGVVGAPEDVGKSGPMDSPAWTGSAGQAAQPQDFTPTGEAGATVRGGGSGFKGFDWGRVKNALNFLTKGTEDWKADWAETRGPTAPLSREEELSAKASEAPWSPAHEQERLGLAPERPMLGPMMEPAVGGPGGPGATTGTGAPGAPAPGTPADRSEKVADIGGDSIVHLIRGTTETYWRGDESGGVEYPSEFHAINAKRVNGKLQPPFLTERELLTLRHKWGLQKAAIKGGYELMKAKWANAKIYEGVDEEGNPTTIIQSVDPDTGEVTVRPWTKYGEEDLFWVFRGKLDKKKYKELEPIIKAFRKLHPQAAQKFIKEVGKDYKGFLLYLDKQNPVTLPGDEKKNWKDKAVKPKSKKPEEPPQNIHERINRKITDFDAF